MYGLCIVDWRALCGRGRDLIAAPARQDADARGVLRAGEVGAGGKGLSGQRSQSRRRGGEPDEHGSAHSHWELVTLDREESL